MKNVWRFLRWARRSLVGPTELFYIQDKRSYVGNAALWWRPNGQGYTTRLSDAGKYTLDEARRQRPTDVPVPCHLAEQILEDCVNGDKLAGIMDESRKFIADIDLRRTP